MCNGITTTSSCGYIVRAAGVIAERCVPFDTCHCETIEMLEAKLCDVFRIDKDSYHIKSTIETIRLLPPYVPTITSTNLPSKSR